jgi:hypothetical protein
VRRSPGLDSDRWGWFALRLEGPMSIVTALMIGAVLHAPTGKVAQETGGAAVFEADPKIQLIAEAYALDAVDVASENFGERLDWTDQSIETVERMAARLHDEIANARPTEEQIAQFTKMLGSYVGEVYRRNHGGTWGVVTANGEKMPGMKTAKGTLFWPWGRAAKRIANGPEDNIWHYYQALLEAEGLEVPRSMGK